MKNNGKTAIVNGVCKLPAGTEVKSHRFIKVEDVLVIPYKSGELIMLSQEMDGYRKALEDAQAQIITLKQANQNLEEVNRMLNKENLALAERLREYRKRDGPNEPTTNTAAKPWTE